MKCKECCGDGYNLRIIKKGNDYTTERVTCEYCHGTGEIEMTEPKLKPCPFCGSENVELRKGFAFNGAVHCNNCTADVVFDAVGLVVTGNDNWQDACIDGWNKRVVAE